MTTTSKQTSSFHVCAMVPTWGSPMSGFSGGSTVNTSLVSTLLGDITIAGSQSIPVIDSFTISSGGTIAVGCFEPGTMALQRSLSAGSGLVPDRSTQIYKKRSLYLSTTYMQNTRKAQTRGRQGAAARSTIVKEQITPKKRSTKCHLSK